MMRYVSKKIVQSLALVIAFPFALLTLFGGSKAAFTIFAQLFSVGPGLPGDYMRSAFYTLTLQHCSINTRISLGTYFVSPKSAVGERVSIGSYCVIGGANIGPGAQIGSHVLIPGGRRQHFRDARGNLTSTKDAAISIGEECWIGDGSILMADIGAFSTIGAGAVVTNPISSGVVAAGNPARPLKPTLGDPEK